MSIKEERLKQRKKDLERRADEVTKISTEVRERLIIFINTQVTSSGRYEYLEKRYGISARKWQNMCNRVQLPGIDMLSSILKDHPYIATWLMLGKVTNGMQVDPTEDGWERKLSEIAFKQIIAE